jgi:AcrR family transcriptional regulator
MSTPAGLRERKKEATRTALHEAAIRLALEHGLDHVTVEAIADAAGVSRRTFSNYFTDKAEALLYGEELRMRQLLEEFSSRPSTESTWTALRRTSHVLYERITHRDREWVAQYHLARKHPSVLGRQLTHYATTERRLAELIREREGLPPDSHRPRVLAGAYFTAIRIATQSWLERDPSMPRLTVVDEILNEMAGPFA